MNDDFGESKKMGWFMIGTEIFKNYPDKSVFDCLPKFNCTLDFGGNYGIVYRVFSGDITDPRFIGEIREGLFKEVSIMSRVPEKWRELAHAWVDGAVIKVKISDYNWHLCDRPMWEEESDYRIDPKCDYALANIPEKHREVYLAWCDGAQIEYEFPITHEWILDDPQWLPELTYRVKSKTIKRWKWRIDFGGKFPVCETCEHLSSDEFDELACLELPYVATQIKQTEKEFDV